MLLLVVIPPAMAVAAAADAPRLVDAVRARDASTVRTLLKQRADVNLPESDGTTALHWAAHWDDRETAQSLIRAGARVNAANRYGVTPLMLACTNGDALMIEGLLRAGADPNTASPEGETPLMTAARTGNPAAVKALLARGAIVDARESWRGQTALMWAASENHVDVVRQLMEAGADIHARTPESTTPFTGGNEALLPATYNPAAGGFTPLLFAVRAGHLETTKLLLEAGAPARGSSAVSVVNDALPNGMSALVLAVMNAHYELAALLLDKGADSNAGGAGLTALHQLVWARNPNRHFNLPPPLPTGTMTDLELAKALVAHGANVNAPLAREPRDGYRNWMARVGATPFVLAAKAADVALMRFLLDNGADPRLKARDNTTALMAAAGIGFWPAESPGTEEQALDAVKLAFETGGDVNAVNDNNYTALHGAAVRGANAIVTFLVEKGAKLDVKTTREGWTPLKIAEGVFIANTFKFQPATAALLRQLMETGK